MENLLPKTQSTSGPPIGCSPSHTDHPDPSNGWQRSITEQLALQIEAPPPILHSRNTQKAQTHTSTAQNKHPKKRSRRNSSTGRKGSERKRVEEQKASELRIGDGTGSQGTEEGRRGWAPGRRRAEEEGRLPLRQGRPPVPRGPHRALPQARTLRQARRQRRPRLPRRRPRVPRRRAPRAGGERGEGQQEEPDHPAAPAARDPQRPGAREAALRRHHRARRCAAQHQPRAAPQEDRRGQGTQGGQGGQATQVAQEGPRHEGGRLLGPPCRCPVPLSPFLCLSVWVESPTPSRRCCGCCKSSRSVAPCLKLICVASA